MKEIYHEIIDWENLKNNITFQIVFTNIIILMLLFEKTRTILFTIIILIVMLLFGFG